MDFQWHVAMDFHLCELWCVIFCPERGGSPNGRHLAEALAEGVDTVDVVDEEHALALHVYASLSLYIYIYIYIHIHMARAGGFVASGPYSASRVHSEANKGTLILRTII